MPLLRHPLRAAAAAFLALLAVPGALHAEPRPAPLVLDGASLDAVTAGSIAWSAQVTMEVLSSVEIVGVDQEIRIRSLETSRALVAVVRSDGTAELCDCADARGVLLLTSTAAADADHVVVRTRDATSPQVGNTLSGSTRTLLLAVDRPDGARTLDGRLSRLARTGPR